MRKTATQIETDIFKIINSSPIKAAINGLVYKDGMRPNNSTKEDAIIIFVTGQEGVIQDGIVNVNIYIPDIDYQNRKVRNTTRIIEIEKICNDFIYSFYSPEYLLRLAGTIQTFKEDDIDQHFVSIRLKYSLIIV